MNSVLLLHNVPDTAAGQPADDGSVRWTESEAGVLQAVRHVQAALAGLGVPWRRVGLSRLRDLPAILSRGSEDIVFNLVEGLADSPGTCNYVPAVCTAFGRACVGGNTDALILTLDKALAKALLAAHGVRVPPGVTLPPGAPLPREGLPPGPLFVKPCATDGSEGVSRLSLVRDRDTELAAALAHVHHSCRQPALVEAFIEGRELNLAVMGVGDEPVALPVAEIDFSLFPATRAHFVDYDLKWHPGTIPGHISPRRIPADLDAARTASLQALARQVWRLCGCRDYARIDCRMDARGDVYVLEVNVNCDLSPLAGFAQALEVAGIPFPQFVRQMLDNAAARGPG